MKTDQEKTAQDPYLNGIAKRTMTAVREPSQAPWQYWPKEGRVVGASHKHPQAQKLGTQLADSFPIVCFVRGHYGSAEADANGYLIAAAPDLLRVIKEIIAADKKALTEYQAMGLGEPPEETRLLMEKARVAIAKAEGEHDG